MEVDLCRDCHYQCLGFKSSEAEAYIPGVYYVIEMYIDKEHANEVVPEGWRLISGGNRRNMTIKLYNIYKKQFPGRKIRLIKSLDYSSCNCRYSVSEIIAGDYIQTSLSF